MALRPAIQENVDEVLNLIKKFVPNFPKFEAAEGETPSIKEGRLRLQNRAEILKKVSSDLRFGYAFNPIDRAILLSLELLSLTEDQSNQLEDRIKLEKTLAPGLGLHSDLLSALEGKLSLRVSQLQTLGSPLHSNAEKASSVDVGHIPRFAHHA